MTPIPPHFDPTRVSDVFRVPYGERATEARSFRDTHSLTAAHRDEIRIGLLLIDVQNTFCVPDFELFVAGRSGKGAVVDNERLCRFIYENLDVLTRIHTTLDTHTATQIFHGVFLVDEDGRHPEPLTEITIEDVESGRWRVNPDSAESLSIDPEHLLHYCRSLRDDGKYSLMVWPYHAMLGGIGHALVSSVEEAVFFHNIARGAQTGVETKGSHPLTENYSALRPEVVRDRHGAVLATPNGALLDTLLDYDALIVAGQAKSHCVAWTVLDLLTSIEERDPALAGKLYLLEDCTSSVVVPGVVDFTDQADARYRDFEAKGMHLVRSTDPLDTWTDFPLALSKERL